MNANQIALQSIILLSFGLISCNPDMAEVEILPKTDPPIQVEIANLDGTYQRIQDTKKLSVSSSIPIAMSPDQKAEAKTQIETRCLSSFNDDEVMQNVEFKGQDQIAVVDILPAKAFTPTRQPDPTLRCHISMQIFLADILRAKVQLENISIENTQEYANDNWDFLKNEQLYFHSTQLQDSFLSFTPPEGEASLLCEQQSQKIFFHQGQVPFKDMINDSLFAGADMSLCRVLVRDLKKQNSKLSRAFYLQNKNPQVHEHFEFHMTASPMMNIKNQAIATLHLKNTSQSTVFIRYNGNQSIMTLSPHYFHISTQKILRINAVGFPVFWQVTEESQLGRVSHGQNQDVLRLGIGETLLFELIAAHDVSCFQSAPEPVSSLSYYPSLCNRYLLLAGLVLNISAGPQLEINSFSDLNSPHWTALPIWGKHNESNKIGQDFWLPIVASQKVCEKVPVIYHYTEMTQIDSGSPLPYVKCSLL